MRYLHELPNCDIDLLYDSEAHIRDFDKGEKKYVFSPLFRDLTTLTSAQCRRMLDELVAPKITELQAWLKTLDGLTAEYEAERSTYNTFAKKAEAVRLPEIKAMIEIIEEGLKGQGLPPTDSDRMAILEKRPGRKGTQATLEALTRDAAYLKAVVALWPTAETTRPHRYAREVEGEFQGQDIQPGDIRELTEQQSRALVNVFVLTHESRIISAHRDVVNSMTTGDLTTNLKFKRAIQVFDAVIAKKAALAAGKEKAA
jgi:hypothetical protein